MRRNAGQLLEALAPRVSDADGGVRQALLGLLTTQARRRSRSGAACRVRAAALAEHGSQHWTCWFYAGRREQHFIVGARRSVEQPPCRAECCSRRLQRCPSHIDSFVTGCAVNAPAKWKIQAAGGGTASCPREQASRNMYIFLVTRNAHNEKLHTP